MLFDLVAIETSHFKMNSKSGILIAWISSNYFESLLLQRRNDSKQSDEFQARILIDKNKQITSSLF